MEFFIKKSFPVQPIQFELALWFYGCCAKQSTESNYHSVSNQTQKRHFDIFLHFDPYIASPSSTLTIFVSLTFQHPPSSDFKRKSPKNIKIRCVHFPLKIASSLNITIYILYTFKSTSKSSRYTRYTDQTTATTTRSPSYPSQSLPHFSTPYDHFR